ncbi:hypothetical protein OS493_020529 [Desmophyllum pertusum]|uniref:Uncharacterized protein n=1 Tax=Desmophyllum pertusum TaxID=174260 RepID=A0A9X0CSQ8_9CNID|nr:hypothetical protein OS493_020529 [Desmophyllum pertusum]
MSLQACSRIVRSCGVASSRQFLVRQFPRRVGERSMYIKQENRPSTKDELGLFIFGLGALSTSIVWAMKEEAFTINMTAAERAQMKEREEGAAE